MRKFVAIASFCFVLVVASLVQAATINVGNHVLQPNTPNQQIAIYGDGGELLSGYELMFQVEMAGNEGPLFTNFVGNGPGTLFGNNTAGDPVIGNVEPGNQRGLTAYVSTTDPITVPLSTVNPIGYLIVSTEGIFAGSSDKVFALSAANSFFLTTDQNPQLDPIITDGLIRIQAVPEPSTAVLGGLAALGALVLGRRRRSC
jgi:hypothetical protein